MQTTIASAAWCEKYQLEALFVVISILYLVSSVLITPLDGIGNHATLMMLRIPISCEQAQVFISFNASK